MIDELDLVVLLHHDDVHGLEAGDVGTIVHCYKNGKGFEVEFVSADGKTIALLTLSDAEIRPFEQSEILHVRDLTALAA